VRDITRRLLDGGRRKILLGMARVGWIDSAGLGALASALASVVRAGGQIKLLKARENVRDLLSTTKLDTVFAIHDGESEALNDFL
jgi:anti-sigma B factor antagonist